MTDKHIDQIAALKAQNQSLNKLKPQLDQLLLAKKQLEKKLVESVEQHQHANSQRIKTEENLKARILQLQTKAASLQSLNHSLSKQLQDLKKHAPEPTSAQQTQSKVQAQNLSKQLVKHQVNQSKLKQTIGQLESKIAQLQNSNKAKQQSDHSQHKQTQKQLVQAKKEVQHAELLLKSQQSKTEALLKERDSNKLVLQELGKQLATYKQKDYNVNTAIQAFAHQKKILINKIEQMTKQSELLKKNVRTNKKIEVPQKEDHQLAILKDMVNSLNIQIKTKDKQIVWLRRKLNKQPLKQLKQSNLKKIAVSLPPIESSHKKSRGE